MITADKSTVTSARHNRNKFYRLPQSSPAYTSDYSVELATESSTSSGELSAVCLHVEDEGSSTSDFHNHYHCTAISNYRFGYNPSWESMWPWLQYKKSEGMDFTLCNKHNGHSNCVSGMWVTKPCTLIRQDKVKDMLLLRDTKR